VRNIGAKTATNVAVTLTKQALIAVRSAPGWTLQGQVLSRMLASLGSGKAVTYRITLYLRSKPRRLLYITANAHAANAPQVTTRHKFG
jgi:hypothetical protein